MLWNIINYRSPNPKPALLLDLLSIHVTRSKMAPLFMEISAHGETNAEIESVAMLLHHWLYKVLKNFGHMTKKYR